MRKRLFLFGGIATLLVIVTMVAVLSMRPTLTINLSNIEDSRYATVSVDDKVLDPSGEKGVLYVTSVSSGKRTIEISHPAYNTFKEEVSFGLSDKTIEPQLEKIDGTSAALEAYKDGINAMISNEKLFADGTWVVFTAGSNSGGIDSSVVVSRYDKITGSWVLVAEGTAIFVEDIPEEIPSDVAEYLNTL